MNKKLVIGVLIGLGLLFVVACNKEQPIEILHENFTNVQSEQLAVKNNLLNETAVNLGDNITTGAVRRIMKLYQPNRSTYGDAAMLYDVDGKLVLVNMKITDLIENELPPLPSDFWKVKYNFVLGNIDICDLEPEYYMQPEFIGVLDNEQQSMFSRVYLPMVKDVANSTIWYRTGFIGYPSVHRLSTTTNNQAKFCVLIYSNFRVQTYQGFKVSVVDADKIIFPYTKKKIVPFQVDKSAFDITSITETQILLEPVIPIFKKGWVKKLEFELETYNKTGQYAVKLDLGYPNSTNSLGWYNQYGALYEAGNPFTIDVPLFQAVIDIKDANVK